MNDHSEALTASYYRCRRDKKFLDSFYEFFLGKSPEIAQKFEHTNFKMQKVLLRQSLLEMLCFDRGMAGTSEEINRIAHRHTELDIKPEMYDMWLDALCEAIQKHDPDYTPELEQSWRAAMKKSMDEMIAANESN